VNCRQLQRGKPSRSRPAGYLTRGAAYEGFSVVRVRFSPRCLLLTTLTNSLFTFRTCKLYSICFQRYDDSPQSAEVSRVNCRSSLDLKAHDGPALTLHNDVHLILVLVSVVEIWSVRTRTADPTVSTREHQVLTITYKAVGDCQVLDYTQ